MKLLMAAGGTGGHVFPALTIVDAVKRRNPGAEILFVGTSKGQETQLVPKAGYKLELVTVKGLKQLGVLSRLLGLALLPGAFFDSWRILSHFSPTVVFGIGGYASGPILLTAALRGMPTAILEPNAVPGFANRQLSRFVRRIFIAFQEAERVLPKRKCVVTGNPIRSEILQVVPPDFRSERRTVLIFGGSQGAKRLNQAMMDALPEFKPLQRQVAFIHQTGAQDHERVQAAYREAGMEADVRPFFDDMASVYQRSDVVVARSGSSVLEIAACGRPSILIPFPSAADDHQRRNARVMERLGAALYLEDESCTGPMMARLLSTLLSNTERLRTMSERALKLRYSDAAERIAAELESWGRSS